LRNLPIALELGAIIWADTLGRFVAIGADSGGTSYSAVSTDGINWSTYALPTSGYWLEMTWSSQLSRMIAVNYQGGTRSIAYSSDGQIWTTIHPNSPSTTNRWYGICWSAELGLYVAVSPYADGGTNRCVMTSSDGTTWTQRTVPATKDWYSVAWSPELKLFAAVSRTGDAEGVMTSSDGVNWTLQSTPAVGFTYITWIPELSMFAAISETSASIVISRNGITWTAYSVMPTAARYYGMVWSREQSKLVVMVDSTANSGLVVTSDVVFPASQNTLLFASPSYASVNNSNGLISMSSMNISSATVGVLSGATFISTSIGNVGNINITQANILTLSTNLISSAVTNASTINVNTISSAITNTSTINVNTISSAIASISTLNVKTLVVDYVTVVSTALGNVATLNATNVSSAVIGTSTLNVNTISSAIGAFTTINATNVSSAVVGASTLNVNTISSATGAFNAINATNVSSAVVGTSTINVNTISSATGAFNAINATNVSSAVVGTSTINVNTISSAVGTFNTINATNVSSAVVGTSTLNVNTISSAIMNASTINVNTISSLSVNASSITTSSINGLTPRNATAGNIMYYDTSSKELTYGAAPVSELVSSFDSFSTGTASIGALNVSSIGGFSPITVTDAIISNSTISASSIVGSVGSISTLNVGNVDVSALNTRVRASEGDQLRAITTWTNQNSISTGKNWRSIVWSPKLKLFAAVAAQSDATNNVMTSPDGVNWTSRTHLSAALFSICWSEAQGKFVAIGCNGTNPFDFGSGNACSLVSTDGITWTRYNTPNWNQYLCITYSPELNLYVAGAWYTPGSAPGANLIYSSDGQTWTNGESPFQIFGVTWSKQLGIFVAAGAGNNIYRSSNGISWTAGSVSDYHSWHAVTWSPELQLFIAVSRDTVTSSHIIRSSDGITWTASSTPDSTAGWTNVTWSPELSLFVVVGWTGSNRIAYSADGITFTGITAPIAREYYAVCWSRELSIFVAASTETGGSVVIRTVNPGLPASLNTITANPAYLSYNNTTNVLTASSIQTSSITGLTPRNATSGNIIYYDASTKELTYGTAPAGTTISTFNSFSTGTASIGALNVSSIGGFSPIRVTDAIISNSTISANTISASSIVSRTVNVGTLQSDLLNIKGANTLVFVGGYNNTTDESNAWYSFNNESNFTAGSINATATCIRYLNGRYYMGVDGTPTVSSIQYSSDGVSWTRANTSLGNAQTVYDIAYGNNMYIACGIGPYTGLIQYSTDGLDWSNAISPAFPFAQPNGTFGGAFCTEYGNNVWLVGGGSWETNVSLYYSTDGSNFVNTTTGAFSNNGGGQGFAGTCFGLGFDGTKFIMTGADPLSNIGFRWSTNGINWSSAGFTGATFGSNVYINSGSKIKYANGMWVAVGFANAPGGPVKYSYDGFSWSNGVGAQTASYKDLSWSGTKWYAAISEASSSNAYQYSYDGINWSNGTAITNLTRANSGYALAILARDTLEISTPTRMYISPAGKVGINTTNPNGTLHVKPVILGLNLDVPATIILEPSAGIFTRGQCKIESIADATVGAGTALSFSTRADSGGDFDPTSLIFERMRIRNNGNVGIGTSTATSKLHVVGDVTITGALSKGSGSFKIDHPLPEKINTHHLTHSFIEGPKADLIYRGTVVLVDGEAVVNIDQASKMSEGTFVALCRDVQCFTTNESDWIHVRGKVEENILTISAQDSTATSIVSWMVIGERKDKHMYDTDWTDDDGHVIVEPLKTQLGSNV
jgi:hypothetical protein